MQPFKLSRRSEFESWAQNKLSFYTDERLKDLMQPRIISSSGYLSSSQLAEIQQQISRYNFVIYRIEDDGPFDSRSLNQLGKSLGLDKLDANLCAADDLISVISDAGDQAATGNRKQHYIPYTNKALSWHTDGYYNPLHQRVQAFILHCQQPADQGGESSLIDPEIVYLILRKSNPEFIEALCREDVMRIPENKEGGVCIREETTSPVFLTSSNYTKLDMRFSQRKRHIIWRDDTITRMALSNLNELLDSCSDWQINLRLNAGEGVICNNVLHRRAAYQDTGENKRVLLRARYYNAISRPPN